MIGSHIGSTKNCGMVLKFERLSYLLLSRWSFGFGSPIRLGVPIIGAFIESRLVTEKGYLVSQERVWSESKS